MPRRHALGRCTLLLALHTSFNARKQNPEAFAKVTLEQLGLFVLDSATAFACKPANAMSGR